MRTLLKGTAYGLATAIALPWIASFALKRLAIGGDRALEGSTQSLALLPGLPGVYVRGAFLAFALDRFDRSAAAHFGTIFSQTQARVGPNVYIGPRCHIGRAHLGRDVMLAAGVHIPSGANTHGMDLTDVPIRDQEGRRRVVHVGDGSWIGSAAIVLEDVGRHSVVAAGAVVTRPLGDYVVAAGVPARVIRDRRRDSGAATQA